MSRVNRFERLDASSLKPPVRMDNGFLRVEGRIARIGIQEYSDGNGSTHRELRLPEEVFDEKSLDSFRLVPVTNRHPPGMLTAKNAKQYAVGSVGENVRADGDHVLAMLMITDDEAIAAAEAGRSQLSNGYSCRLDDVQDPKLIEKWGKYDFIQRDIRGNHCALVEAGRAGPETCLRLDSGDMACGEFGGARLSVLASQPDEGDRAMPHKFKLDGFDIEVADANAQAVIERVIESARKSGEIASSAEKTRADAADKALAASQKSLSELQAKHDSLESQSKSDAEKMTECSECEGSGKVFGKECEGCGGKGEYAAKKKKEDEVSFSNRDSLDRVVARRAQTRAALVVEARKHLSANEKLDELNDLDIKKKVIAKLDKDLKLDGKDETYVSHRYDFEVEKFSKAQVRSIDRVRTAQDPSVKSGGEIVIEDEKPADPVDARGRMTARLVGLSSKK